MGYAVEEFFRGPAVNAHRSGLAGVERKARFRLALVVVVAGAAREKEVAVRPAIRLVFVLLGLVLWGWPKVLSFRGPASVALVRAFRISGFGAVHPARLLS